MSENNTPETGATPTVEEKTFSQDEVNRIVQERLSKERTKLEGDIVSREQQLRQREFLLEAKETLQAKGLPASLLDALNTSSKEAFERSLAILEETQQTRQPPPPPYASGTGSNPMLHGLDPSDVIRQGMGLK